MHKWILRIGFTLVGIILGCLAIISIVSVMQGAGGMIVDYSVSGWKTSFIGIAYIPVIVVGLVVIFVLVVRWLGKRGSRPKS